MQEASMTCRVGGTPVSWPQFCFLPHSLASRSCSFFRQQWGYRPSTHPPPSIHRPSIHLPTTHPRVLAHARGRVYREGKVDPLSRSPPGRE